MTALDSIINEIKAVAIAAVGLPTPPAGARNWFTSIGAIRQNFTADLESGNISLPCLVLSTGDFATDTEFGIGDVNTKRLQVTLYYIAQVAGTNGKQGAVADQALALGFAFDDPSSPPFRTFFVIEPCTVLSNIDSEITQAVAVTAKNLVIAAQAAWLPGFQIQFTS